MSSRRRFLQTQAKLFVSLLGAGSSQPFAQAARTTNPRDTVMTIGVAIDRSGRQRMLSQRMAKAYAQILSRTIPERSQRILRESVAFFDESLGLLSAFAPDAESKTAFEAQRSLWTRYRSELDKPPSATSLEEVMNLSDEVLKTGEAATAALTKVSATNSARIVNISGRQRMLSQRIAKFYAYGFALQSVQRFGKEIEDASRQFTQALQVLEAFPQNTESIKINLSIVRTQWAFFEQGFRTSGSAEILRTAADNVAKASENILQTMDTVTDAYAKIAG